VLSGVIIGKTGSQLQQGGFVMKTGRIDENRTEKQASGSGLLGIEQAIAMLKTSRPTFYRWVRTGKIKGTKVGRQWRFRKEDLDRFLQGEAPATHLPVSIRPLVEALDAFAAKAGIPLPKQDGQDDALNVLYVVSNTLLMSCAMRATDVHFIPTVGADSSSVAQLRFRVDGALKTVAEFDIRLLPAIVERFKIMANCNVHANLVPQDGRIQVNIRGQYTDMRICFLPTALGESVVLRILSRQAVTLTADKLGLPEVVEKRLLKALAAPYGLILTSGPTGSGKTTTLYACLLSVTRPEKKVMTIEDPVEYLLPGVQHTGTRPAEGLTFAAALRATLRCDPDVIMIGEVRDPETLEVALKAALTGHLVLSTLHTPDAASALVRMVEMEGEPFMIGDATRLIVSQRLIRKLCQHCARPVTPVPELLAHAREIIQRAGLDWDSLPQSFREPVGCPKCNGMGFKGRMAVIEALEMSPEIAAALRRKATVAELRALAIEQGMVPMAAHGVQSAAAGKVHLQEVLAMAKV